MNWYVLYVKTKQEIKVAQQLSNINIEAYAPYRKEIRQWSDRKKRIDVPLFRSYVFVKLSERERHVVFDVPGVARYLYWLGRPAIVRDEEIETLKNWLGHDDLHDFVVSQFNPGDQITISRGILKGKEVQIEEVGRSTVRMILKELGVVVQAKIKELV